MIFLNPTVLFGLIAASIPLIIHLINFKKLNKIEFSTLSFLKELQKSKIKKVKIKQWLLLLLRTLIITFLVLAFAKPTLESNSYIDLSPGNSVSLFILDNSFSMQYVDDEGSYFNKAKKAAKEIINKNESSAEYIVLISGDSVIQSSNKGTIINAIDDLNITYATESLLEKINKGINILSKKKFLNKELFILSDFQNTTFDLNNYTDSLNVDLNKNRIFAYGINFAKSKVENYAINNIKIKNTILELNKPIKISANIYNYGTNNKSIVTSLFINNKRVAQKKVELRLGINPVFFTTSLNQYGYNSVYAQIEDDKIIEDNKSFSGFFIQEKINALLVYDNNNDIEFLKTALSLNATRMHVTTVNSTGMEFKDLNNYDIIYYVSKKIDTRINDFIKSGGTLVIFPPSNSNLRVMNQFTKSIDFTTLSQIINISDKNNYDQFKTIDFNHPIFDNLLNSKDETKLESPKFYKFYKLQSTDNIKPIIELNNSPFLVEGKKEKGIILLFNTSPVLDWSNFPIKSIFAPIIFRSAIYSNSKKSLGKSSLIKDKITVDVSNISSPFITIKTPSSVIKENISNHESKNYIFDKTFLPGNYIFNENNNLIDFASVNVNILESNLTSIGNNKLDVFFKEYFKKNYLILNFDQDFLTQFNNAKLGKELWKHFLIIVILLAILEMYISRSTKKDITTLKES